MEEDELHAHAAHAWREACVILLVAQNNVSCALVSGKYGVIHFGQWVCGVGERGACTTLQVAGSASRTVTTP